MTDAEKLQKAIIENATSAASVSSKDGSMTAQSIDAQIAADRYRAAKASAAAGRSPFRVTQINGPGAIQ